MKPTPPKPHTPIIYAGRFADRVNSEIPGTEILSEWDVLPTQLTSIMEKASFLVVLDPLSFPFEVMTEEQWNVPLFVALPDYDADSLVSIFGTALLEKLEPFDRVATPDPALWEDLRLRYSWPQNQHVSIETSDPEETASKLLSIHGDADHDLRTAKTMYRAEAQVLRSRFSDSLEISNFETYRVLEIGTGHHLWASSFDLSAVQFAGVYEDENTIQKARQDFPGCSFTPLNDSLSSEDGSFDLSFSVNFMQVQSDSFRRALISEMWRVTRPGGRLLFFEDFVNGEFEKGFLSATEFLESVLEATSGRVVLDHVESVVYPGEDVFRGGLISLHRLGGS